MLFVINIGNTNTQYGLFIEGSFQNIQSCPTKSLTEEIIPKNIPIAYASVVKEKNGIFNGYDALEVSNSLELGLNTSKIDISTVGADRIANAVSLSSGKLPAICIDCGTALTFEVVSQENEFLGGAIAPGRKLMRKALHDHTSLLPEIPFSATIPRIGTNTVEAITSGIDNGIIGSVKEIIEKINNQLKVKSCRTVIVGGDAEFLCSNIDDLERGSVDFTLRGIAEIWEQNL